MGCLLRSKYMVLAFGGWLFFSSSIAIAATGNAIDDSSNGSDMMMGPGCHRGEYGYGPGMAHGMGYGNQMMMGKGRGRGYGYRGDRHGMMGGMIYGAGMTGLGIMSGQRYGLGMFSGFGRRFENMKLNLTVKQRQQLDEIREKSARHFWSLFGQMQEYRIALARSLMSLEPNQKSVDQAFSNLSQTREKLLNLHLSNRKAALKVLTQKQRKLLEDQAAD